MQAVILAAGRGSRMGDLTNELPKPLLIANGKTLLEHKLEQLPAEVDEVIFVIGYLGEKIREKFGDTWQGKIIKYVEQKELNGTGGAVHCAKDLITGKFLVMMGDDLYVRPDIEEIAKYDWALLVHEADSDTVSGKIIINEKNCLRDIIEGAEVKKGELINAGMYVLQKNFFDYPLVQIKGKSEFGLPQTLLQVAKDQEIKMVKSRYWKQMTAPQDLMDAEKFI